MAHPRESPVPVPAPPTPPAVPSRRSPSLLPTLFTALSPSLLGPRVRAGWLSGLAVGLSMVGVLHVSHFPLLAWQLCYLVGIALSLGGLSAPILVTAALASRFTGLGMPLIAAFSLLGAAYGALVLPVLYLAPYALTATVLAGVLLGAWCGMGAGIGASYAHAHRARFPTMVLATSASTLAFLSLGFLSSLLPGLALGLGYSLLPEGQGEHLYRALTVAGNLGMGGMACLAAMASIVGAAILGGETRALPSPTADPERSGNQLPAGTA